MVGSVVMVPPPPHVASVADLVVTPHVVVGLIGLSPGLLAMLRIFVGLVQTGVLFLDPQTVQW